jgi:microcystin degradation protein MlrC
VVADYADNPGGGAYGDATSLLAALLDAGVPQACFGPMVDPAVAAQLQGQPVGAEVDVLLGGKSDPRLGGGPLALRGRLRWRGEGLYTGDGPMIGGQQRSWGPTAVLQVQGIAILVVTHAAQMWDQQQFKAFGIDPQAYRVVALKSAQHFRAAFEPIAGEVIVCDSGALAGPDCTTRRYERAPRPVFPLEQGIDLAQWRTKLQHRP